MELFEAIKGRRSIRKFQARDVPDDIIERILDAARHAPSSQNCQPWEFIIVRDRVTREAIAATRDPDNRAEAAAPVLIVVCADTARSKSRWIEDGTVAAQNILLAAAALGLGAVWLTGWCGWGKTSSPTEEAIRKELSLPAHIRPVASIAIGWPAEPPEPKEFRELKDMIHQERW